MRTKITLECTECKQRNYNMTKDKKNHPDRMETKKFKKCTWPKKEDLVKQSALVIVVSVLLGVLIAGVDWVIRLGLTALHIVS